MSRNPIALLTLLLLTLVSCTQKELTYTSVNSLSNATIAAAIGSSHDGFATANFPNATIVRPEAMAELAVLVSENRADYAILDRNVADAMIAQNDKLFIVDPEVMVTDIASGFNKENTALRDEFNRFMSSFSQSDTFADIQSRWNGDGRPIPSITTPTQGKVLRAGVCDLTPPFCLLLDNQLQGSSIEIVKHFAQWAGYKLELMPMNFSALLASLQSGKIDILISGLTYTEERAKSILFSDIYQRIPSVVIANRNNVTVAEEVGGSTAYSPDQLLNSRIVVLLGSTGDAYVSNSVPSAEAVRVENVGDLYPMLSSNNADFMITDVPIMRGIEKEIGNIEIVEDDLFAIGVAAAFPKQATALQAEFDAFLAEFMTTETYAELYDRWFERGDIENIPLLETPTSGKRLIVGTDPNNYPSTTIVNNYLTGFEVELMRHFSIHSGYQVEFMQTSFASIISGLATQKIDVGMCAICVTAERQKRLLFSTQYQKVAVGVARLIPEGAAAGSEQQHVGLLSSIKESFINNIVAEQRYKLILGGIWVTLIISVLSIILGTLVGSGICMLTMSESRINRALGKTYVTIMRGTPVLVILMINFYVIFARVPISPVFVATISFALNFGAYVSEMFRSSIISIDKGQSEAGWAMGFTKVQTFIFFVAPQAIKRVLPVYKGEAISLVKMTSIVGYIAVQDITKISDIIRSRTFDAFFPLLVSALLYFLIAYLFSVAIDLLTSNITRRK